MRRLIMPLLLMPFLLAAEGDCGGGSDEPNFGGGGAGAPGDDDDGGATGDGGSAGDGGSSGDGGSTGGSSTGSGDDTFISVSVSCEGDNSEYTWTYSAELSIQASYVTVEVDPEQPDYEAWYLDPLDDAGTLWAVEVTELYSSRDCSREAELLWTSFGFGSWEESTTSTYSP